MAKKQELVAWGWPVDLTKWQNHNWTLYGLNTQAWRRLFERQGGKCAGCGEGLADPMLKNGKLGLKPQIDHRHRDDEPKVGRKCEESAVRGLLCGECNRLLGQIQDNKALMERLVAYLKQHGDY